MLTNEQILQNKAIIEAELSTVKREGIDDLIKFLDESGFYTQAASTKYHQNYRGGLAEHSIQVFKALDELNQKLNLGFSQNAIIVSSLLHDVCKVDNYKETINGFIWNSAAETGHARKSIRLVKQFIDLTLEEEMAIMYHMGAYEKKEFDWGNLSDAYKKSPLSYYIHVADMKSTYEF